MQNDSDKTPISRSEDIGQMKGEFLSCGCDWDKHIFWLRLNTCAVEETREVQRFSYTPGQLWSCIYVHKDTQGPGELKNKRRLENSLCFDYVLLPT